MNAPSASNRSVARPIPVLLPDDSAATVRAKAASVVPTPRQVAWQRREFTAFIHFGMNTFTDREWGDGTEDPTTFNPSDLDVRQWVRTCKEAGMSTAILTAKHHDGFCLWQSAFTDHCMRNSPYKNGCGDVVQEFADACREYGLGLGLYVSPWDRHEATYGDSPRYNEHFCNQLRELLTRHPETVEVWFDGACAEGPNGKVQVYDWRAYWELIRSLVPEAAITVRGPDVRWCGNEAGSARVAEWSVMPLRGGDAGTWRTSTKTLDAYNVDIHGEDLGGVDALLAARAEHAPLVWYPAQVNTSIRPGWFYHTGEDRRVRNLLELTNIWYGSVGGNGQFLLNIPPDRRGHFHEADVERLTELGQVLRQTQATDLAAGGTVRVEVAGGQAMGDAQALLANNQDHCWTTTDNPTSVELILTLPQAVTFNVVSLQEHLPSGQRAEGVAVDVRDGAAWREIGRAPVIGHRRMLRVPQTTAGGIRVRLLGWRVRPTLSTIGLHQAPLIIAPPEIARDRAGNVTITPPPGTIARYTLDGSDPTSSSPVADGPIALPRGGMVRARSEARTAGSSIATGAAPVAWRSFGLATALWTASADSEEPGAPASAAIDDDLRTIWHTPWSNGVTPLPHHLDIDFGRTETIAAVTYLPRQDQWGGGIARTVSIGIRGEDGVLRPLVVDAVLDNAANSRAMQTIPLPVPTACRGIRFTITETYDGDGSATAGGIGVLPA